MPEVSLPNEKFSPDFASAARMIGAGAIRSTGAIEWPAGLITPLLWAEADRRGLFLTGSELVLADGETSGVAGGIFSFFIGGVTEPSLGLATKVLSTLRGSPITASLIT